MSGVGVGVRVGVGVGVAVKVGEGAGVGGSGVEAAALERDSGRGLLPCRPGLAQADNNNDKQKRIPQVVLIMLLTC